MATLREVARVTQRGNNLPDVTSGELKANAWLVHQSALGHAQRSHSLRIQYEGVWGYQWKGNLKSILRDLWPAIPPGNDIHRDSYATSVSEKIYRYLRVTKNANCLERNLKEDSVWFIREEWNDQEPEEHKPVISRQAARLSSHEAGEDREPAPVELAFKCPYCKERFHSRRKRTIHIYSYAKHVSLEKVLAKALLEVPVPSAPRDVYLHLMQQDSNFAGSESLIGLRLKEAAEDPTSGIVMARIPGRISPTYTLQSRLSEMPKGKSFTCREPGCGAGPFSTAYFRSDHENAFHKDTRNRPWKCMLSGCEGRFYDIMSLSTHLWRSHNITKSNPETTEKYESLLEKAKAGAASHIEEIVTAPWPGKAAPEPEPEPEPGPESEAELVTAELVAAEQPVESGDPRDVLVRFLEEDEKLREENQRLREENSKLSARLASLERLAQALDAWKSEN